MVQIFHEAFLKTLILESSEALHIDRIANITKALWILCQISKLFLNFAQTILSATTVPHLLSGADTDLDEGIPLLQLESQHVPVQSQSEIKSPDDKKSAIVEINEDASI